VISSLLVGLVALANIARSQSPAARELSLLVEDCFVMLIWDVRVPATQVGPLTAISVKEGQSVDKDMLLANIDDRESRAKHKVAQGEEAGAIAQSENLAEIEVAEKAIDVSKTEMDLNEQIRIRNPSAISLTELNKYKFQWE